MGIRPKHLDLTFKNLFHTGDTVLPADAAIARYRCSMLRISGLCFSLILGIYLILDCRTALRLHSYIPITVETILYCAFLCHVNSKKNCAFRADTIVGVCLLMGAYLLFRQGLPGTGPLWLLAAPVLAAVFIGFRAGILCVGLDAAVWTACGLLAAQDQLSWQLQPLPYAAAGLTLVLLSFSVFPAGSLLIHYLNMALLREERLNSQCSLQKSQLSVEVEERQGAEARALHCRDYDDLTQLYNREKFIEIVSAAIPSAERRSRHLAVLIIGLDQFRQVNETWGHSVGDKILVRAATSLRKSFRQGDEIGRLGNDLFAVLCTDISQNDDVLGLICKAQTAIEHSDVEAGGLTVRASASMGVAIYPNDGSAAEDLLRCAEAALHLAKEAGPGSYRFFDPVFNQQLVERAQLEMLFDSAIQNRSIEPWYQPKVDAEGRIVGVEALARWVQPDGSLKMPCSFIDIAERSGSIVPAGRIMLEKACQDAALWAREGLPALCVAVNLSPYQFRYSGLCDDVRAALAGSDLDPSRLELEITETGIEMASDDCSRRLEELKELGVSISIDDFGTGASSISHLRDYPVDTVKIPKELVDPILCDERASMIAQAIIELAHNLNFKVVAEGIEEPEQYSWLRAAHCDQFQGYLFSRPLALDDFKEMLAKTSSATVE